MRTNPPTSDTAAMVVAVTGHRDLVAAELPLIRSRVREFLQQLRHAVPQRGVSVMSGLAEGADQLVAEVALELGLPLIAVLPMPSASYASDFTDASSLQQFRRLCCAAAHVIELPVLDGHTAEAIARPGTARDAQYVALGDHLCRCADVLLALWDGKPSDRPGGTAQVVAARRASDHDRIGHVVCSRDRPDGAPAPGLQPAQAFWWPQAAASLREC